MAGKDHTLADAMREIDPTADVMRCVGERLPSAASEDDLSVGVADPGPDVMTARVAKYARHAQLGERTADRQAWRRVEGGVHAVDPEERTARWSSRSDDQSLEQEAVPTAR